MWDNVEIEELQIEHHLTITIIIYHIYKAHITVMSLCAARESKKGKWREREFRDGQHMS